MLTVPIQLDALAQAELVSSGEATPLDLVDAAIARIEAVNPRLNAVITPLFDKARAAAASAELPDGPFRGVPFLLKDLGCHSAGDPYHEGLRFLRDLNWVAERDTYMAAKLREAGFIFVGKTNTPELALLPTTEPEAYGPTRNPWDSDRSPGGSSGGSAAAVAAGMVPAAHANDGGGSIRIPASACGLVGLKPSRGRVSVGPEHGEFWQGMAAEHVVTRSVRDCAAILDVIAGPMPGDPYTAPPPSRPYLDEVGLDPGRLRIGLMTSTPGGLLPVHPDCVGAAQHAARLLESLGHRLEESHPPALDDHRQRGRHFWAVLTGQIAASVAAWSKKTGLPLETLELNTRVAVEIGRTRTAQRYIEALEWLHADARRIASWWAEGRRHPAERKATPSPLEAGFDVLLTPTLAEPPPRLGQFVATPADPLAPARRTASLAPFTPAFNVSGQPAISVPLSWNADGLPVGMHLVAAYGREDVLIRLAAQLEQAHPWADKWPPDEAS